MKDVKNAFLISKLAKKFSTNIEILAIASVLNLEEIDSIILGINSFKQLKESISFYNEAKQLSIEIKQKKDLYKGIDSDGSTFERWLPALSKK